MARVPDGLGGLTRSARRDLALMLVAFGGPMVVLTLQRCVLHAAWGPPSSDSGPLALAFVHGLRFDAAGVAYPFAVALVIATVAALRRMARLERLALAGVTAWVAFVAAAELPFFAEFRARLDGSALEYLDDPATVIGTATDVHLLAFGIGALVGALVTWLLVRALRRIAGDSRLAGPRSLVARGVMVLVLAVLIRGGVARPLRPADAAASSHHLTQLTLSGPWTLLRSAYEGWKDGGRGADYGVSDASEALRLVRERIGGRTWERDDRPVLRHVGVTDTQRRNVIVVVLESFAARHVGALGAGESWTPALDALIAERGDLFRRCLANGPTTNRALPALLAGLPSPPRRTALTKSLDGQRELLAVPRVLRDRGWRTTFVIGGAASWENLGGWARTQGFEEIVDRGSFEESDRLSVWGVADGPLLDKTMEVCDEHEMTGDPFYVVALTGSNHPPFAVPDTFRSDVSDDRMRAFLYADESAAAFVRDVLARRWAPNTDIYLVGDHGITATPQVVIDPERHHVLLWSTHGGDDPPESHDALVSHVDVPTEILETCGYHGLFAGWGGGLRVRDGSPRVAVLGPRGGARAIAVVDDTGRYLVDDLDGAAALYRWTPPGAALAPLDDPSAAERLRRAGRAYLHLADRAIREGRAGR